MKLNNLNFKNGVFSEPINENFEQIDEAIRNERLSIGGYGISYGLEHAIDGLNVSFNEGHVIDKEGQSFYIVPSQLRFDPPAITSFTEKKNVLYDGAILLTYIPYGENGQSEMDLDKIIVTINNAIIDVVSISENKIFINKKYANLLAIIDYHYALNRIDQVIVENNALVISKGGSAHSPSLRIQEDAFCVGCFKINPFAMKDKNNHFLASLESGHYENHLRNIYTNSKNELFLNGIKVSNLGFVHFEKPIEPVSNMLWYDAQTNKLCAFIYNEWVALQDGSKIPVKEVKLFEPSDAPADYKTYFFHKTKDMNMRFVPGKNALQLCVDQYVLFKDQFNEISYADALADDRLKAMLTTYDYALDENFSEAYENVGIGFELKINLNKASYVEAHVTHHIIDAAVHARHQRSATFIRNGYVNLEPDQTEFETEVPYRYNENQLQLFTSDKNYFNRFDYDEVGAVQGELTKRVKFRNPFGYTERVHYRITTNVYSYDHIAKLLEAQGGMLNANT